jgi:2-amino-4-hydroxy-6-hydroxymethyldihydropteridine diphosphokinase
LTIHHPRAKEREFVLVPLAEIVPEQKFPDGESVAEKLKKLEEVVK